MKHLEWRYCKFGWRWAWEQRKGSVAAYILPPNGNQRRLNAQMLFPTCEAWRAYIRNHGVGVN